MIAEALITKGIQNNALTDWYINDEYRRRWADMQFDGTLEAIDQGLELMIELARAVGPTGSVEAEEVLNDLECAAYATAQALRPIFALDPARQTAPPFAAGHVLSAAVEQFLSRSRTNVLKAIEQGATLATACSIGIIPLEQLTEKEIGYRTWVTPRLITHILPEAIYYEDVR